MEIFQWPSLILTHTGIKIIFLYLNYGKLVKFFKMSFFSKLPTFHKFFIIYFQIVGFLTGILVGVPTAAYITYNLMDDETPKTPFLENIGRKKAARPAIIVQEELKRVYVSQIF
jgi:hypothetical protein